jgi:hypothetical protein
MEVLSGEYKIWKSIINIMLETFKGIFSKPSGNRIVAPMVCLFS